MGCYRRGGQHAEQFLAEREPPRTTIVLGLVLEDVRVEDLPAAQTVPLGAG